VVIGIALLFLAGTTISGLVYGVSVWDPYIVIGCTAVIVVVCLLSATIPGVPREPHLGRRVACQHAVARRRTPRPFELEKTIQRIEQQKTERKPK